MAPSFLKSDFARTQRGLLSHEASEAKLEAKRGSPLIRDGKEGRMTETDFLRATLQSSQNNALSRMEYRLKLICPM